MVMRRLLLAGLLFAMTSPAQPFGSKPSAAERQLAATTRALVAAIKAGSPSGVLPYLSSRGVVVDMDGERVPLAGVRQQFTRKIGLYCRWFDTACLAKEMDDQSGGVFTQKATHPRSYREILQLGAQSELNISIDPDKPTQGSASVCVHGPKLENDGAGYLLEFGFERTGAGWKLALEEGNFAGC